jgi:predicted phage terminase large subunit-like protein
MSVDFSKLNDKELLEYETLMHDKYNRILRENYLAYVEYVNYPAFVVGKHTRYVCNAVQQLIEGRRFLPDGRKVRIMIITEPPQHGKSLKLTEALPSWALGNHPSWRVIEASYNEELALRFGRRNREKIETYGYDIFGLTLKDRPRSDATFETTAGGGMISRGYMSGITGNPAELIIIDDPIKNRQEADSETDREKKWDEYLGSIRTRLHADGYLILILTRWHEDDIAGRIIERESIPVEVIRIPCEAEEGDILGRKVGDPLFPEIGKDARWLKEFKRAYVEDPSNGGVRTWNAMFQCRPSSLAGNIYQREWWNYWIPAGWNPAEHLVTIQLADGTYTNVTPVVVPANFEKQMQSWDLTFKGGDGVDNVAGGVIGTKGSGIFLLDAVYRPMSFTSTISAIQAMTQKWPRAALKYIERKANGEAVYDMLQHRVHGIVLVEPNGRKEERASASSPLVMAGNVYLPHPRIAPWVNEFIEQTANFPNAPHDDYVDMLSQALLQLMYSTDVATQSEKTMAEKHKERLMQARSTSRRRRKH